MNVMELLLLSEEDTQAIMNLICEKLGIAHCSEHTLVLQGAAYELSITVVSRNAHTYPPDFFTRQITHLHQHYKCVATDAPELKNFMLEHLEHSTSLVIIEYSYQNEGNRIQKRVHDLSDALSENFADTKPHLN